MVIKKDKIFRRKRFWAGLLLAQFLLFFILSKLKAAVVFFEYVFELKKTTHLKIFSWIPFSAGDFLYIILIALISYLVINSIKKKTRNNSLLQLLVLLNLIYLIYQLLWGMLYFQEPIISKLSQKNPTADKAEKMALIYLERCKQTRLLVTEDVNGVFTIKDFSKIENKVLRAQHELPNHLIDKDAVRENSFKPSIFKGVMSFSGILGYYNPFTAEAQYNSELPKTFLPFTLAHESAHQMGFAREQEANFIAYLIGKNSDLPELRYSTEFFVLKSLLANIHQENPQFVEETVEKFSPGMKRDRAAERKFVEEHSGLLDSFFMFTNDLFLKANQQEGSVTYSYFVDLLLRYEENTDQ